MSDVSLTNTIATGQQRSASKIQKNFEDLRDFVNGDGWIDLSKIGSDVAAALSLSQSDSVRRGKSITATEQGRTNTGYGPLSGTSGVDATDEVRDVVLATDGLLMVGYRAIWKESVAAAARAASFIDGEQIKVYEAQGNPAFPTQAAGMASAAGVGYYSVLHSSGAGLVSDEATPDTTMPTTGVVLGSYNTSANARSSIDNGNSVPWEGTTRTGICVIEGLAAGTYDVSVRFKATSGTVTAKDRKLWVWTLGF